MKVAIYSDPLMGRGGGSRVAIELANHLNADIITSGFDKRILNSLKKDIKVIDIGNYFITVNYSIGYLFEAPIRFLFFKRHDYDVNIYLGCSSIFAAKKGQNNIWFCFTPNRIMYDLRKWKLTNARLDKKLVYLLHILLFNYKDQQIIKNNFSKIIAQTKNVKQRVSKFYKMESTVIYSPVDTSKYRFNKFEDYFLTVSRLVPEKRIDLIAKAFMEMKTKKLIIVGNGSEKEYLLNLIKGNKNIILKDSADDFELAKLYSNCLATIFIPLDEDFGLVPIEGMASGKICIAANEGGCLETVIDNKTGYLIEPTVHAIINAVQKFNVEKADKMKSECIKQAKKFDIHFVINQWKNLIAEYS